MKLQKRMIERRVDSCRAVCSVLHVPRQECLESFLAYEPVCTLVALVDSRFCCLLRLRALFCLGGLQSHLFGNIYKSNYSGVLVSSEF